MFWGAYTVAEISVNAVNDNSYDWDYRVIDFEQYSHLQCDRDAVAHHCSCFSLDLKLDMSFDSGSDVSLQLMFLLAEDF